MTSIPADRDPVERVRSLIEGLLPRGRPLPPDVWQARHRGFVIFLWLQSLGLFIFGIMRGFGLVHSFLEASIVAFTALLASRSKSSRRLRAITATIGLISASAILVHLSGGTIEAHFHFFVMISLITLYQEWAPFLLSIGYVVIHHGLMGTLDPTSVYNHPAAIQHPFKWAAVHGVFVFAASVAGLIIWRRNEDLREREQLNEELHAFSARAAHDLKTPLVGIQGAASTALSVINDTDDVQTLLHMIERQALRAQHLVESLLDLARARGTPRPQMVSAHTVVEDVAADFPALDVQIEHLPRHIIVDPVGLRQCLSNLFGNAQRYASGGARRTPVTILGGETPEGWTVGVADRGPGVPAVERTQIFDPLTQGRNAGGKGAGLGLSIVTAITEAHGGRAWYEPREGGGAEFWMFFPRPDITAEPPAGDLHEVAG